MTVRAFIGDGRGEVVTAGRDDSVATVVALLAGKRIGCVPIVEGDQVLGIFSERDVIYGLQREGAALLDKPVGAVMTTPIVTIAPDTPILSALSLMTQRRVRHLPIVESGRLIGFVSIGDLVKSRMDHMETEVDAMRTYIQAS